MDLLIHKRDTICSGNISISGAKNSAVAIIPAALLSDNELTLYNIPNISDVTDIINIIKYLGHNITFDNNIIKIKRNNQSKIHFNDLVTKLRGSYYFISVYLSIFKEIYIKDSGGCKLGSRPIDFHINAFKNLGVTIKDLGLYKHYSCNEILSKELILPYPSVGATINIILLCVKSKATVKIVNCAFEPEVIDICNFLNSLGGNITINNDNIIIIGVTNLYGFSYTIISDRIEAGTYLALGTLPNISSITISNINHLLLSSYLNILKEIGYTVTTTYNKITINKNNNLSTVNVTTSPHPGFPTDLAPILTVILTQLNGISTIKETVFLERFSHIGELNKLGANITRDNNIITIKGKTTFKSGIVISHDLRCSAALLICAIASCEDVVIKNVEYLLRGYEDPIKKLQNIGIFCSLIN